jgi:hypothetical protein
MLRQINFVAGRVIAMLLLAGCSSAVMPPASVRQDASAAAVLAAAAEPADLAKQVVGEWVIPIGDQRLLGGGSARYQFAADGTFTLTFHSHFNEASGSGTWQLNGTRLTMVDKTSDTGLIRAGEIETADVISITSDVLTIATKDIRGRDETDRFFRVPPFVPGAENAAVIGTWMGRGQLVLTSDGRVVVSAYGVNRQGRFMQTDRLLILRLAPPQDNAFPTTGPTSRPVMKRRNGVDEALIEINKAESDRNRLVLTLDGGPVVFHRQAAPTTR